MSSSRIIKSGQPETCGVGSFVFQPLSRTAAGSAGQAGEGAVGGFVPLGIFDPSEVMEPAPAHQEAPPPSEVEPGISMSEEEFQSRLKEAFEQGLTEGKNLAERGLVNVFRSLRGATESVQALREKVMRESEDDLIDLVMKVARKVILREVAMDRGILLGVVQTAIAALSERCEITIRLNPDDYILVTTGQDATFRRELLTERMRLKSDPAVLQGSCLVDSEMGTLDAGIEGQLDEIFRRLLEERNLAADGNA